MSDRFLAFRMFGEFAWPPIPGKADPKDCKAGAVEIFFVRRQDQSKQNPYSACVRWTPLEKFTRGPHADDSIDWVSSKEDYPDSIYALDKSALEKFVNDESDGFFLRISSATEHKESRLEFRGGDYFEQFAVPSEFEDTNGADRKQHRLKVRIPLVRLGKDGQALTGIIVGQPGNPGIRVELALPTPMPLAPLGGTGGDYGAFAFAVVFSGPPGSKEYLEISSAQLKAYATKPLVFDSLVFGPPKEKQSYQADSGSGVSIGTFLFSRHSVKNGNKPKTYHGGGADTAQAAWTSCWLSGKAPSGAAQGALQKIGAALRLTKESPSFSREKTAKIFKILGLRAGKKTCEQVSAAEDFDKSSDLFPESIGLWIDPEDEQESAASVPSFRVLNRFTLKGVETGTGHPEEDVRVENGKISLQWHGSKKGWQELGTRISVMADLRGHVSEVLTYDARADGGSSAVAIAKPPKMQVETRIGWTLGKNKTIEKLPGLSEIKQRFAQALDGAKALDGAQPAMLLPEIELKEKQFDTLLSLRFLKRDIAAIENGKSTFTTELPVVGDWRNGPAGLLPEHVAPARGEEPGLGKHAGNAQSLPLTFPLFYRSGSDSNEDATVRPDPALDDATFGEHGLILSVAVRAESSNSASASIGGLACDGISLALENAAGNSGVSLLRAYRPVSPDDPTDLELRLRFRVARLIPIGVDVPRGEQRISPIMYDENRTGGGDEKRVKSSPRPFTLDATETLSAKNDRVLTVELRETIEGDQEPGGFVLFSEEPFGVKRAIALPIESRGSDDGIVVAKYSSLDRSWHALARQNIYHYVLPPQSIGESMDKPSRLELQDAEGETGGNQFERPVPDEQDDKWKSGVRRRAVEFRLTPPTDLWVRPSDVPRRFVLPEWAAGELFVQRGEQGLGVALAGLAAEFVYGISSAVDPSKEQGPSRRARVTEVEALLGRPVPWRRLGRAATASDSTLDSRWNALGRAYATRPERLEIWADDPNSSIPFAPARFSGGARFVLRHTALHRHPVMDAEYVVERPNPPRDGNVPDAPPIDGVAEEGAAAPATPAEHVEALASALVEGPRFHPHGLSGGALWPVELQNVLDMILREPVSSGGSIEKIALSTLGGDADQTARFADNRAAIITETRGGYVQRQKLEIIGRIGVLWHRAKHVIVYERTVNPTAQFAPGADDGHRTRRPVLRKVEEYIEILQPERRYPDIESAQPHTSAFLAGVRFNSRIIPVDSGWAEEIGEVGYAIPLWNRYAARVRPQVYKRPDVAFVLHAEGAGDGPEAPQECLNPENLYFFANTGPGLTDDTDRWPQLIGVDATDLPPPRHDWMLSDEEKKRSEKRPIETTPKGFGRFTWRLAAPTARTTINAGRAETAVYTALESVTFARSVGAFDAENIPYKVALERATGIRSRWVERKTPVFDDFWEHKNPISAVTDQHANQSIRALSVCLSDLSKLLPEKEDFDPKGDSVETIRGSLGKLALALNGDAKKELDGLFTENKDKVKALKETVLLSDGHIPDAQDGKKVTSFCKRIANDFRSGLTAKKLVLKQHLNAWAADVDRRLVDASEQAGVLAGFEGEDALTKFLSTEIAQLFAPAFSVATKEVGKLQRGIETARAIVADTDAGVAKHIDRLHADLHSVRHAIEQGKPWSEDRIARLRKKVNQAFDKAHARLQDAVADGQHRLAVELDEASQRVAGITAHALAQITHLPGQFDPAKDVYLEWKGKLEGFQTKYDKTLADPRYKEAVEGARKLIDKVRGKHPGIARRMEELIGDLDEIVKDDVRTALRKAIAVVDSFEEELAEQEREALRTLSRTIVGAGKAAQAILADINALAESAEDDLKNQLLDAFSTLSECIDAFVDEKLSGPMNELANAGSWLKWILQSSLRWIEKIAVEAQHAFANASRCIDEIAESALKKVEDFIESIQPDAISKTIVDALLRTPELKRAIKTVTDAVSDVGTDEVKRINAARAQVPRLVARMEEQLDKLGSLADVESKFDGVCDALSNDTESVIEDLKSEFDDAVGKIFPDLDDQAINEAISTALSTKTEYEKFHDAFQSAEKDIRRVGNELAGSIKHMETWGDQAIDAIGKIGKGDLASAPNNILKALAAVGSGPELPNLDYARDRLGYYYGRVNDVVDTTPVEAWFGRLGDSLKAMGISLQFDKIGDRLLPVNLSKFDIGQVLGNFAGLDLSRLFRGIKMPKGAGEAVRLTHEFDRKAHRAWVQIDINLHKSGRNSLFAIGPFSMDMVDARLVGFLRMEASKDTDRVEETGEAKIITDLAAMVAGQMMVTLKHVTLTYARDGGLQVDFDPKNIRISPTLRFVENTLKSLFPDDVGGMEVVKNNGIPVGLRHTYALPPMALMFGTSGVQNIQISNQFELIAFPDFLIANRFALARPDQPFLFTIFIIGGTGWLTVDVEYRPFDKAGGLLVVVEAGAGGSASLAFAFAGVTGSVFITVSVALTYRKLLGKSSGGGLSISAIVVITGLVDVLRIARAMITVMLRLNYQDNGDIDAVGSFRITIRISRFFKISVSGQARYRMKGGKKETSSSTQIDVEAGDERLKKLRKAAKLLKNA